MIRIELDEVRQDLNVKQGTYRMIGRARCRVPGSQSWIESSGFGQNARKVCETLKKMGVTGEAQCFRGETQIFAKPFDIETMAETGRAGGKRDEG